MAQQQSFANWDPVAAEAFAPEDLASIYRLRYRVYVQEQHKVYPWTDHQRQSLSDSSDPYVRRHFVVRDPQGEIIAAVRAHTEPMPTIQRALRWDLFEYWADAPLYYISKLVVDPRYRRSKATSVLMTALYKDWISIGSPFGFLHCAERFVPLYRRLGFHTYARPFEDLYAGWQVPMLLPAGDEAMHARHASIYLQSGVRPSLSAAERWFASQRQPGGLLYLPDPPGSQPVQAVEQL
ncbi:MAG: GNAT family N-acetyltransferase [Burkholderiaceae bacterium]